MIDFNNEGVVSHKIIGTDVTSLYRNKRVFKLINNACYYDFEDQNRTYSGTHVLIVKCKTQQGFC